MADFNGLFERLEAKVEQVDKLEALFAKLSFSRVMDVQRSQRIATSIIVLLDKFQERFQENKDKIADIKTKAAKTDTGKAKAEKEIGAIEHEFLKETLIFLFEQEKDTVYGIIMDVFDLTREDAELVPFSCIYGAVASDPVVMSFLQLWQISAAETPSSILPNQPPSSSQRIPPTSKPGTRKNLTGSKLKPSLKV